MKLVPYPEYKEAGVPWVDKIPKDWMFFRGKNIFKYLDIRSETGTEELLSVSERQGVTPRRNVNVTMFQAASYRGYKLCWPGDLVINSLWAWMQGLGFSKYHGIISTAYGVYRPRSGKVSDFRYFDYLLRSAAYKWELRVRSKGIWRSRYQLKNDDFLAMPILVPRADEQTQIARFLDWKTAQINRFIRNKRRLIELLKEQKQNIINRAVTRGLDPNIKLKPSGVEWIGDIPEHWEVRKLKHIAAMKSGDNLTSDQIAETGEFPVYGGNGLRGYFSNYNKDGKYLLVGRQGALCGNVHRVEGKFWATEHAVVTDVRPGISIDWYYYMLTVMNLNQYSESAAQPGISVEKIQNLRTALPSLEEQEAIVSHIEKETATIDYTITQAEREIELIREYRARLISDVVTGQVDVRGIEVPEVAEDELLALDEDTAESNDVIDDEGVMDETD